MATVAMIIVVSSLIGYAVLSFFGAIAKAIRNRKKRKRDEAIDAAARELAAREDLPFVIAKGRVLCAWPKEKE